MLSPCRVKLIASDDQIDVHIEEAGKPGCLVYAIEDERHGALAPVRRACRSSYLRTHQISHIDLRLDPGLSWAQRSDLFEGLRMLLRMNPASLVVHKIAPGRALHATLTDEAKRGLLWWLERGAMQRRGVA